MSQKRVGEKSRECHNHKPQPFPDTKRKRKPTNPNKHKPNKRTKSTKISALFPKQGNRNTKRTENTRTKWHTERHTTNRPAEQTTKQQRARPAPGPPPQNDQQNKTPGVQSTPTVSQPHPGSRCHSQYRNTQKFGSHKGPQLSQRTKAKTRCLCCPPLCLIIGLSEI